MSIQINKLKCVGCGKCIEACPGNLIKKDTDGKAFIKHVKDCWGCTSCLKECRFEAINFSVFSDVVIPKLAILPVPNPFFISGIL